MIHAKAGSVPALTATFTLGPLALMVSGPFLLPNHTDPIPSFWNEWWAVALGLFAAVLGLGLIRRSHISLPSVLGIPAILLAAMLLQHLHGAHTFPTIPLLQAAYLLWAGLLMMLGRHLADTIGIDRLVVVLAAALAACGTVSAGIALLQWLGLAHVSQWIFAPAGRSFGANIGQVNHHAHYLWLGIASMFYLHGQGHLPRAGFWPLVAFLAFASLLGGSRSIFLYACVPLAVILWVESRISVPPLKKLRLAAIWLLPLVVALNILLANMPVTHDVSPATAGERLFAEVSGPSIRLALTRTAWSAFLEAPLLGQSAGSFPWASFSVAAQATDGKAYQVMEHAHNLVLNLLVEFGAPATLAILGLLLVWGIRFLRQPWSLPQAWCASILGIGLIHAMLEYPYWYAYFLGPTALLLGACDSGPAFRLTGGRIRLYLLAMAVAGSMILANLRQDYLDIETISLRPLTLNPDREVSWRLAMDRLLLLHRESLLSPWALLGLATLAEPDNRQAEERIAVCMRVMHFMPARLLVTRCAIQHAIAGKQDEAESLLQAALRAFPGARGETLGEIEKWSAIHPQLVALRLSVIDEQ
ncbi:MAG: Wzy polymerase domain-containing protein [Pseudomonadota bacterium]